VIPRRCKSQIFRDNYPSDDPEHFFREAIFASYLDHLIVEMKDRFFDQKQKCLSLWDLIPKYCDALPDTAKIYKGCWKYIRRILVPEQRLFLKCSVG